MKSIGLSSIWMAILLLGLVAFSVGAGPPLTHIVDTVYRADGSTFNGVVEISWPRFLAPDGSVVSPGSRRINVRYGVLQVKLVPYSGYAIKYLVGDEVTGNETWNVPTSATPVKVVNLQPSSNPSVGSGSGGSSGGVAVNGFADSEVPGGAVNGVNRTYLLLRPPNPIASLQVFRNGILQKRGLDYSVSASTVTFVPEATPQEGDLLIAWYRY